jgi:hypothetical protein
MKNLTIKIKTKKSRNPLVTIAIKKKAGKHRDKKKETKYYPIREE